MDGHAEAVAAADRSKWLVIGGVVLAALLYSGWLANGGSHADGVAAHDPSEAHSADLPPALYSVIPFAALLGSIAILPLLRRTSHWWEHNRSKLLVAVALAGVTLVYYAFLYGHGVQNHRTHAVSAPGLSAAATVLSNALLVEYVPFMTLLFSLYVISGGISLEGRLIGRPILNAGILLTGAFLASFIGTTGAAMLLIRPLLRANVNRRYVVHTVVFFIFAVCNTGGCLLPIGDPPLFLGYLRGVPFLWTLTLWPMWLAVNLGVVTIYYIWERIRFSHEDSADATPDNEAPEPLAVRGGLNFVWLAGVIVAVGTLDPGKSFPGTQWHAPLYFREMAMLVLAALSLWLTPARARRDNHFHYAAILEVAALFLGIFVCMQAPIQLLNIHGPELGLSRPWQFFWASGTLSSFLDNAPTYVVFFETAKSLRMDGAAATVAGVEQRVLIAISLGSVFMGAMTYIGNGPNFMVKAIAEANNVRMPSFFGFMAYSLAALLPMFVAVTLVFLL